MTHDIGFWIELLLAVGVGMGCGSYATMMYYRLPNGEKLFAGVAKNYAHCVECGAVLRTRDMIPLLNWLWTHGKCYNCGFRINPVYFFIELGATLLSAMLYLQHGFSEHYIIGMGVGVSLVVAAAMDFTYARVDEKLIMTIILFSLMRHSPDNLIDRALVLAFAVVAMVLFKRFRRKWVDVPFPRNDVLMLMGAMAIWYGDMLAFVGWWVFVLLCLIPQWLFFRRARTAQWPFSITIACIWLIWLFNPLEYVL